MARGAAGIDRDSAAATGVASGVEVGIQIMKLYGANDIEKAVADMRSFYKALPGKQLEIRRHEESRSDGQQGLLHIIIRKMAQQTGAGEEVMKQEILKRNKLDVFPHWPHDIQKMPDGSTMMVAISESKLTRREEADLITHIHALCVEWGVEL